MKIEKKYQDPYITYYPNGEDFVHTWGKPAFGSGYNPEKIKLVDFIKLKFNPNNLF